MNDGRLHDRATLGDLMVLVAASGCCVALGRYTFGAMIDEGYQFEGSLAQDRWLYQRACYPPLVVLTLAALILRLRGPRPSGLRLRRQPGFVASIAVLFMVLSQALFCHANNAPITSLEFWADELTMDACNPVFVAPGVLLAWLVQWIVGACRPEKTSVDRLGRGVGWTWVASYLLLIASRYLSIPL